MKLKKPNENIFATAWSWSSSSWLWLDGIMSIVNSMIAADRELTLRSIF